MMFSNFHNILFTDFTTNKEDVVDVDVSGVE
jgi:hypothetical protein